MATTADVTVRLDRPHAKQRDFMRSTAKRRVIVAGRRGGKTTGAAMLAVEAALDGKRVLEAAPTSDQTGAFWDTCRDYVQPLIESGFATEHKTTRTIDLATGGRIRTKTAYNADTLRGDYADLLILDEFSLMTPDTWSEVGSPMLLDNDGDAVFIFTPKRRNHAYRHYVRAQADESGRWKAWHFTSHDNPHLSAEALDEITQDMTHDGYRQEIMAEFLSNQGAVFRRVREAATVTPQDAALPGHQYAFGVDWAQQHDFTAIAVVDVTAGELVYLDRFNQIDYTVQRGRLTALYERFRPAQIIAEVNSIGRPVIESLQRDGLPVQPFTTTNATKAAAIDALALAFERGDIGIIDNPALVGELLAFEQTATATGLRRFAAPEGMHDDTVIALALAWQGAARGRVQITRNPFYE